MGTVGRSAAGRDLGNLEGVGSKNNNSLDTCSVEAIACQMDTIPVPDRIGLLPGDRCTDVHYGESNWAMEGDNLDHSLHLDDHMDPDSGEDVLVHQEDLLQENDQCLGVICNLRHPRVSLSDL